MTSAHRKFSEPGVMSANCLFCLAVKTSKPLCSNDYKTQRWRKATQRCFIVILAAVSGWLISRRKTLLVSGWHFLHVNHSFIQFCCISFVVWHKPKMQPNCRSRSFFLALSLRSVEERSHDGCSCQISRCTSFLFNVKGPYRLPNKQIRPASILRCLNLDWEVRQQV